jgi:hypothetical protein
MRRGVKMKKIIISLLLLGLVFPAVAQDWGKPSDEEKQLKDGYEKYLRSENDPGFVIPYLGRKLSCFIYYAEDDTGSPRVFVSGGIYKQFSGIADEYAANPTADIPKLMKKYALSGDEAITLGEWAMLYKRLPIGTEVVIVPKDSSEERELLAKFTVAKLELDRKFGRFKGAKTRKKAFYAVKLMTAHLLKGVEEAEKMRPTPSGQAEPVPPAE